MEPARPYKTWGKNRSVRLKGHDYREQLPYHVTICAIADAQPFITPSIAEMACKELREIAPSRGFYLATYCLMPDHLHILLSPDQSGLALGEIIGQYKGKTTNESWKLGWKGKLWQDRFHDHIVRRNESISETAKYILRNPERAGLSEDYPYRWADPEVLC